MGKIGGALTGGLLAGSLTSGGSGSGKNTTTTVEPPAFLKPYLMDAAQQSRNLYGAGGQQYFPGSTAVPFSPQTQQALDMIQQRAQSGGQATNAAQGYASNTLGGEYLKSNPFVSGDPNNQFLQADPNNPFSNGGSNPQLDNTFNRAADSVQQRIQSGFAGSGRNIEAGRPVAAQEFNDLATNIYGGAYESDANRRQTAYESQRNRMQGAYEAQQGRSFDAYGNERKAMDYAAGIAPGLDQQDYVDLQAQQGVGSQYDDLAGRQLQDQIDRFNYQQRLPGQTLDEYIARLNGSYPGQSTSTTGPGKNTLASTAGGALTGFTATGSPYGAAAGALLGYFG